MLIIDADITPYAITPLLLMMPYYAAITPLADIYLCQLYCLYFDIICWPLDAIVR